MQRLRDKRGLTQSEVGERMGVNPSMVSRLENANVKSDLESVLRYFHALDADLVLGVLNDEGFVPVSEAADEFECASGPN
jgi:transcriptional regulator with XRE-family HTH domain